MGRYFLCPLVGLILIQLSGCEPRSQPVGRVSENVASDQGADERAGSAVVLFAATSAADALDSLCNKFRQSTGISVQKNFASTATLAQQVLNGAEADLLISASTSWAEKLQQAGLVQQQRTLMGNRLVLIVPANSKLPLESLTDLVRNEVQHVALGDPESVPAGVYARQALVKLGIWEQLRPKVVSGADVRQALTFVETGSAEAGIVYATDAAISRRVQVVTVVDPELSDPIHYPALLLRRGAANQAARQLFDFLADPESAAVFRQFGFTVSED